jgi:hypothetical protein
LLRFFSRLKAKLYRYCIVGSSAKGAFKIQRAWLVKNNPRANSGFKGLSTLSLSRLSLERITQSAAQGSQGKSYPPEIRLVTVREAIFPIEHLQNFIQQSINAFPKCLNKGFL